jgi:hypothetical protein
MRPLPENWFEAPDKRAKSFKGSRSSGDRSQLHRSLHVPTDEVILLEKFYYQNWSQIDWWSGRYTKKLLKLCRDPTLNSSQIAEEMNSAFKTHRFTQNVIIGRLSFLRRLFKQRDTFYQEFTSRNGVTRPGGTRNLQGLRHISATPGEKS